MLRIGPLTLESPFAQAALSGYSDWPMRVLARRHGAAYTVHEVLIDRFVRELKHGRRSRQLLRVTDEERPAGAQLMGSDPDEFPAATRRLVEAGFDVIDINFGCPVRSALGGCRGGYHLGQPAVALEIVRRVRDAAPPQTPVTLKLRRGLDDSSASRDRVFEIIDGALAAGVAAFTVHGRTVAQKYDGPSRWEFLREVKRHLGATAILGSGDLFTAEDCVRMLQETGVDGVSIARGAIGNPWIFSQARALLAGAPLPPPPDLHTQRAALVEHWALAEELYGPECLSTLRKFGIKYARLHPEPIAVRDAFVAARTPADWHAVIARWYAVNAPGRHPQVDEAQPLASVT